MYPFRKKLHPGVLVPIQFLPNSVQEDVVDVDLIEREGSGVSPPPPPGCMCVLDPIHTPSLAFLGSFCFKKRRVETPDRITIRKR